MYKGCKPQIYLCKYISEVESGIIPHDEIRMINYTYILENIDQTILTVDQYYTNGI